jgi:hypothetical protein
MPSPPRAEAKFTKTDEFGRNRRHSGHAAKRCGGTADRRASEKMLKAKDKEAGRCITVGKDKA